MTEACCCSGIAVFLLSLYCVLSYYLFCASIKLFCWYWSVHRKPFFLLSVSFELLLQLANAIAIVACVFVGVVGFNAVVWFLWLSFTVLLFFVEEVTSYFVYYRIIINQPLFESICFCGEFFPVVWYIIGSVNECFYYAFLASFRIYTIII